MWTSVALETDAASAERLSDALLAEGAISTSIEDADAGTERETPQFGEPSASGEFRDGASPSLWSSSRVIALFEPCDDLLGRVAAAAAAAGIDDLPEIELGEVAEENWVQLTQSQFDPIRINERLWIVPSWHAAPDPAAINLILDPGMAFGTGSHPTTRLCLEWLCANIAGNESVLDFGCGSGILGMAASRLGAARVLATDIDPHALEAARANAERNAIPLDLCISSALPAGCFDRVVANILTNPLCVLAPLLCERVAPGGRIALSGVLAPQADEVIAAYAPWLSLRAGAEVDGWVRLEGERPPC
jgi:ribosomal protein L11 methyltransferase